MVMELECSRLMTVHFVKRGTASESFWAWLESWVHCLLAVWLWLCIFSETQFLSLLSGGNRTSCYQIVRRSKWDNLGRYLASGLLSIKGNWEEEDGKRWKMAPACSLPKKQHWENWPYEWTALTVHLHSCNKIQLKKTMQENVSILHLTAWWLK